MGLVDELRGSRISDLKKVKEIRVVILEDFLEK